MNNFRRCPGCSVGISQQRALCWDCERKLPTDVARRTQILYFWDTKYHGEVTAVHVACTQQFEKVVGQINQVAKGEI